MILRIGNNMKTSYLHYKIRTPEGDCIFDHVTDDGIHSEMFKTYQQLDNFVKVHEISHIVLF